MNSPLAANLAPVANTSKEDAVYERLRKAILSGQLAQGQRLIPGGLAPLLGTSSIPVRNALSRLEAEQLVSRVPSRGFMVRPYSHKEVQDLFAILPTIEALAARLAAQRIGEEQLAQLRACVEEMEAALSRGDTVAVREANRRFHTLFHAASGNEQLATILSLLRDRSERYRVAYHDLPDVPGHTVSEHKEALRYFVQRDAAGAAAVIERDVQATGAALLRLVAG